MRKWRWSNLTKDTQPITWWTRSQTQATEPRITFITWASQTGSSATTHTPPLPCDGIWKAKMKMIHFTWASILYTTLGRVRSKQKHCYLTKYTDTAWTEYKICRGFPLKKWKIQQWMYCPKARGGLRLWKPPDLPEEGIALWRDRRQGEAELGRGLSRALSVCVLSPRGSWWAMPARRGCRSALGTWAATVQL